MNIPPEILEMFKVQPEHVLGGRLNQHWRVKRGEETLVMRRWYTIEDVPHEQEIRSRVAALGWPVPLDVSEVVEHGGFAWSLMTFLPGEAHPQKNSPDEQRQRGRLLAEFHLATAELTLPGRTTWRTAPETLSDPEVERVFQVHPNTEESQVYLWHLERSRELAAEQDWSTAPLRLIHGDFTPWNLLFRNGQLSGLLDFELSRMDFSLADFCLSWRGQYDGVIHAYHEVLPLLETDRQGLTPIWWAFLLELVYGELRRGQLNDGWAVKMLLRRSSLIPVGPYTGQ